MNNDKKNNIKRNNLKKIRKHRGMSQAELSRRSGVTTTTIYLIEKEKVNPTIKTAAQIANALETDVRDIFFDNVC